jgi:hypothetical protein
VRALADAADQYVDVSRALVAGLRLGCLNVTTRSVSLIDEQILAIWCALRVNPSLDARWAMEVIDRLLDERPRYGQVKPSDPPTLAPPSVASPGPVHGSSDQHAILASVIRALLADEPG